MVVGGLVCLAAGIAAPDSGAAQPGPARPALPSTYDIRVREVLAPLSKPRPRSDCRRAFGASGVVTRDRLNGGLRLVARRAGFLCPRRGTARARCAGVRSVPRGRVRPRSGGPRNARADSPVPLRERYDPSAMGTDLPRDPGLRPRPAGERHGRRTADQHRRLASARSQSAVDRAKAWRRGGGQGGRGEHRRKAGRPCARPATLDPLRWRPSGEPGAVRGRDACDWPGGCSCSRATRRSSTR